MTKEEKRDRRKLKHQLQKAAAPSFLKRMGMHSTSGTIRAAVKSYVEKQVNQFRHSAQVEPISSECLTTK